MYALASTTVNLPTTATRSTGAPLSPGDRTAILPTSSPSRRVRRQRGSLRRDEVIEAAFRTLRTSNLSGLTMQAVARQLQVPVMTLYTYVRSKDELLAVLADHVAEVLYSTSLPQDLHWRDLLHQHAMGLLREMTAHPGYADLMFFHG